MAAPSQANLRNLFSTAASLQQESLQERQLTLLSMIASGQAVDGTLNSVGTDVTSSATGAAGAITATLAGVAAKTTYITGFEVTGLGATLGVGITVTVTGTISGTLNYAMAVVAGILLGTTPLTIAFTRPIPSSAVNTAIVVNVPTFGTGNTLSAVTAHGFQL